MHLVVTGGGTGGHVTPIRYVTEKYKQVHPDSKISYIGQKGDRFVSLLDNEKSIDEVYLIKAGKFRRYQRPLWQTMIDLKTWYLNIRDFFFMLIGLWQSWSYLGKLNPDAVFSKGGFVSVPVAYVAKLKGIPIVTHDSDIVPGLANKMVGKWATKNCVGHKSGSYPYPKEKVVFTGVPVNPDFYKKYSPKSAKSSIGLSENPLVFVIGGSLGAKAINDAMISIAPAIVEDGFQVVQVAGSNNMNEVSESISKLDLGDKYIVREFISDPDEVVNHYAAADVVISRAGATNTAELAAINAASIIIPASQLYDQKNNAAALKKAEAAIIMTDSELQAHPRELLQNIKNVIGDKTLSSKLKEDIAQFSHPEATSVITSVITEVING